ncbi:excalibur calcium-binding domain-containing protein [Inhella sp.]|uniref:excalibur calcium-binding domain-containing protein n=1 Tax=Inhella sp. TaxID=1921806 RepID=UPI0035AF873A
MGNLLSSMRAIALLLFAGAGATAAPLHKCVLNGSVTFQQSPCPSGQTGQRPTVEKLNAERRLQRPAVAASAAGASAAPATKPEPTVAGFRCDGRQHCSQMKSCAEAKYFLANCPGVKMDGDRDGVPCEEQWCGR